MIDLFSFLEFLTTYEEIMYLIILKLYRVLLEYGIGILELPQIEKVKMSYLVTYNYLISEIAFTN